MRLIEYMVLKIVNTSSKCPWRKERRRFKFIKTFLSLSPRLLKRRGIRLPSSSLTERLE